MKAEEKIAQDNASAIEAFLLDISCLEKLKPWVSKVNLFEVLKISRTEIRHSNILAWLLDSNENHGLNDIFVRGVINKVVQNNKDYLEAKGINILELLTIDYSHFTIDREWENIDILLSSKEDKLIICIENKIGTGEHDDQLARYKAKVESTFLESDGYDFIYIYLTPENNSPSDIENWLPFSYADILEITNSILVSSNLDSRVRLIIENYVEILRRFVVKDKELEEICASIYKKHKQALDLIFENRPDGGSSISNILNEYLEERAKNNNDIIFIQNKLNAAKSIKRFSLESFDKIFPPVANVMGGWGEGINYFWEIKNFSNGKITFAFVMYNFEQYNGGKATRLAKLLNMELRDAWIWKTFKSFVINIVNQNELDDFFELGYDDMKKEIIPKIDKQIEKVFEFEKKVLELWTEE